MQKKVQFYQAPARRNQAELSRNLATFLSLNHVQRWGKNVRAWLREIFEWPCLAVVTQNVHSLFDIFVDVRIGLMLGCVNWQLWWGTPPPTYQHVKPINPYLLFQGCQKLPKIRAPLSQAKEIYLVAGCMMMAKFLNNTTMVPWCHNLIEHFFNCNNLSSSVWTRPASQKEPRGGAACTQPLKY